MKRRDIIIFGKSLANISTEFIQYIPDPVFENRENLPFLPERISRRDFLIYGSFAMLGLSLALGCNQFLKSQEAAPDTNITFNNYRKILFTKDSSKLTLVHKLVGIAEGNLDIARNIFTRGLDFKLTRNGITHVDPGDGRVNFGIFSLQLPNLIEALSNVSSNNSPVEEMDKTANYNPDSNSKTKRIESIKIALKKIILQNQDLIRSAKEKVEQFNDSISEIKDLEERNSLLSKAIWSEEFDYIRNELAKVATNYQLLVLELESIYILQKAEELGIVLNLREFSQIVDIFNQSPLAAIGENGALEILAALKNKFDTEKTPSSVTMLARTLAYVSPKGKWGSSNNYFEVYKDQRRRNIGILKTLEASGINVFDSQVGSQIGEHLRNDSNTVFTAVPAVDKMDQNPVYSSDYQFDNLARFRGLNYDDLEGDIIESKFNSAASFIFPGEIVLVKEGSYDNKPNSNTSLEDLSRIVVRVKIDTKNVSDDLLAVVEAYNGLYLNYFNLPPEVINFYKSKKNKTIEAGEVFNSGESSNGHNICYFIGITSGKDLDISNDELKSNWIACRNITPSHVLVDREGTTHTFLPLLDILISGDGKVSSVCDHIPSLPKNYKSAMRSSLASDGLPME